MICQFCQGNMSPDSSWCNDCQIDYIYSGIVKNDYSKIMYMNFHVKLNNKTYILSLSDEDCYLLIKYHLDNATNYETRTVVELDYRPDINPTNAPIWINKLLKLKAFS
jgi:hypothetical protein